MDKVRSPYLIVTTILWLSTVDLDFGGGRTEFLTGGPEPLTPLLIEPKIGRFAAWTSGWEVSTEELIRFESIGQSNRPRLVNRFNKFALRSLESTRSAGGRMGRTLGVDLCLHRTR